MEKKSHGRQFILLSFEDSIRQRNETIPQKEGTSDLITNKQKTHRRNKNKSAGHWDTKLRTDSPLEK